MIKTYFRRHPIRTKRALEILPGFVSWSLILFPFWGSLIFPVAVAYYVIAFAVYWLYRSLSIATLSILAHFKIKAAKQFDWISDLKSHFPRRWKTIHHIVIIPTYKEPIHVLRRTLEALSQQSFPTHNIHLMVSFENREGKPAREKAIKLKKEFKEKFGHLWITYHPDIEGEVKGKSANTSWGAKKAKQLLVDKINIPIENVTITSQDADAVLHPHYFSNLTYAFLKTDKPYNRIWQGNIVFYNNIWRVPAPIRVMASIFSVMQMYILMRKDRLINFSTYSTSLRHVHEIGYWDTDVIPEDYRLFFKSYFAKKGDFEVEPIFLPIYQDAVESSSTIEAYKNQYEQLRRWAWGTSDDAYIIRQYVLAEEVPFLDKTIRVLKVIEDHFLWPVNWFAITVSAILPPLLNEQFNRTVIGKTLPQVTSFLLTLSLVSMAVIFIIDALNRPPRPNKRSPLSYIIQPLEFLMLPIIGFFFSALPGIDAHTRLMMGKYIEYRVTQKV
ncbi:glycosyltransferase family 2 protein [Patescibacteria group bacterium]|nr:glycosyltransferase family 2 protein [Patescibacteria group bacterium]MBU1966993.1 glycosyltransferase family 2 protein [Patescibacteria group bacterium]MBU2543480.1 glycosyltransferase family 2 protein [Patescibacteria group bacterium]